MKVSNEHCPSNFGGFMMCLGVTISSSDELILGSEGEYGSSFLLELLRRSRLRSLVDVLSGMLAVCWSLSRARRSVVRFSTSCVEPYGLLGGVCGVKLTFASVGLAARLDVPLEWHGECQVLPTFASVSAFPRGCRCSGVSSSSDSSLSYSRIFLSLVF